MKKLLFLLFGLFLIQGTIKADNDKLIQYKELPQQAQAFVKQHFDPTAVALVKMETDFFDKSYEIIFSNGDKLEFDKSGIWKEVDCRYTALPTSIIPAAIQNYVSKNYPDAKILKIEKKRSGDTEIDLSNHLELTFDSKYNLVDIDD